jgi:hypothetical protein
MNDGRVWTRLSGEEFISETATYDVDHVAHAGGETVTIDLTVDMGGISLTVDMDLDEAESFIRQFRDEIVRARQARIEWETDTDPETGISERCE